jgi:hypothetical protein
VYETCNFQSILFMEVAMTTSNEHPVSTGHLSRRALLVASAAAVTMPAFASDFLAPAATPGRVGVIGDLRLIATRNLVARASLAPLLKHPDVVAIGMLDTLNGELWIADGKALLGEFGRDRIYRTTELTDGAIAFLVYARVPEWVDVAVPGSVTSFQELEAFVPEAATAIGLDPGKPLPFRLRATAVSLRWFLVGGPGNGIPDPRESFLRAFLRGGLEDTLIDGVGFWSAGSRGVFTNPVSGIHIHFRTPDGFVGHLDDEIMLQPGATIRLPGPKWQV